MSATNQPPEPASPSSAGTAPCPPASGRISSRLLATLRKSTLVKNMLVVMTGTAAAQIIGFALSPLISRLFSPADFGVFGSFGAVSGVLAACVTLEYTQAIMLPKDPKDAMNLFVVSCLATFGVSALCLLMCLLFPGMLHGLMKTSGYWMLALLVLTTAISGINSACQAWCIRSKAFAHTSASQVVRSVSANGTQIGFGCLHFGASGLIVSSVLGDLLATVNLLRVLVPDIKALRPSISWERIKALAREYRDFPMYAASQNVVATLSQGLPVLLLTQFYGIAVAGAYAFGIRILQTPMGFVLRSLRQVLLQKACETQHEGGSLVSLYIKITAALFALAVVPALALIIWAPAIFDWVFGAQWKTAGEFARSLMLWMAVAFCNLPAVLFAQVIRIQRAILVYDLVGLAARTAVLVLGGLYASAPQTILAISILGAVTNLFLIVFVGRVVFSRDGGVGFLRIRKALDQR